MAESFDMLIYHLSCLSSELEKSGKNDTSKFFSVRRNIISDSEMDSCNVSCTLKELATCRAIAQYGNFSYSEEVILDKVVDEAIVLLSQ